MAQAVEVQLTPSSAEMLPSSSVTFNATVTGAAATTVTWSVQEAAGGTVDSSGRYTAPSTTGSYHVVATSTADASVRGTAAVTVTTTPTIGVSVWPRSASVSLGQTLTYFATVTGTLVGQSTAVNWSVSSGGGTISAAGVFTPAAAGTYQVTGTSVADPGKSDTVSVTVTSTPAASARWMMAYWAGWAWDWSGGAPTFDGSAMTHVAFGHVLTTSSGGLVYGYGLSANNATNLALPGSSSDQDRMRQLVNAAHAAGVKAVLMIGGSDDPNWLAATTAANRPGFESALLSFVTATGLDGVDLDWENNYGTNGEPGYTQLTALVQELRAARPSLFISVPLNNWGTGAMAARLNPYVDQLNVMTYDMSGDVGTWYHSALYGTAANGATGWNSDAGIAPVLAAGVPASKVGIGAPLYGYGYAGSATAPGIASSGRTPLTYKEVMARLVNGSSYATYAFDGGTRCPAVYDSSGWIGYEDEASIREKAIYAKAKGLGGGIIWLQEDATFVTQTVRRNPLLEAMKRQFLDRSPSVAPRVGTPTLTRFATGTGATGTVAVSGLGKSVVWWDDINSGGFDLRAQTANAANANGAPSAYVIEASSNGSTWNALATVTGNTYVTRSHVVDLTGYTQVRMRLTGSVIGAGYIDLGVHDIRAGSADDYWLFLGDSITSTVFVGTQTNDVGRFGYNIHQAAPSRWPIALNGGVDGGVMDHFLRTRADPWSSATGDGTGALLFSDGRPLIRQWLADFPGKYVSLGIGANDINGYSWQAISTASLDAMQAKLERMIKEVLAAGKTPVLPTLRWLTTNAYTDQNLAAWNTRVQTVILPKYPSAIAGPDLFTPSRNHPEWLQSDNTHPNEAGRTQTRQVWTDWAMANVYNLN